MESQRLYLRIQASSAVKAEVNCGPLSKIKQLCSLKQMKTCLKNSSAIPLALIVLLQGVRITPFKRPWLTMTSSELKLLDKGRLVMRSIDSCWKGWVQEEGSGKSVGTVGWVLTFICWQTEQPAMNWQTNVDIPGHQ